MSGRVKGLGLELGGTVLKRGEVHLPGLGSYSRRLVVCPPPQRCCSRDFQEGGRGFCRSGGGEVAVECKVGASRLLSLTHSPCLVVF